MYNGDYIKSFVNDFIQQFGPLNILFTSNNTDVIRKAITNDLAITFSPNWYTRNNEFPSKNKVKELHIVDHALVKMAFGLVHSKKKHLSASSRKFIKYLEKAFNKEEFFKN